MMHRIENAQPNLSRSRQQLQHMRDAVICLCNTLDAIPELAALGYEIVIGIDEEKPSNLLFKLQLGHAFPPAHPRKWIYSLRRGVRCSSRTAESLADCAPRKPACERPGRPPTECPACPESPGAPASRSCEPYW